MNAAQNPGEPVDSVFQFVAGVVVGYTGCGIHMVTLQSGWCCWENELLVRDVVASRARGRFARVTLRSHVGDQCAKRTGAAAASRDQAGCPYTATTTVRSGLLSDHTPICVKAQFCMMARYAGL